MNSRRTFSTEFKCQIVEEVLAGVSTVAQLSRRHELAPNLIYRWKQQYTDGKLWNVASNGELALKLRVLELERLVGELLLENKLLKKAARSAQQQRSAASSIITGPSSPHSKGGVS